MRNNVILEIELLNIIENILLFIHLCIYAVLFDFFAFSLGVLIYTIDRLIYSKSL